jgi:hypothetical protein
MKKEKQKGEMIASSRRRRNDGEDKGKYTYRAFTVTVAVAFAFPQRKIFSWLIVIAHQDKPSGRRHVTVVFGTDTVPSAAWNALNTVSLIAV